MTFYCDVMLGKLAKYLRILGLDTVYLRGSADLDEFAAGTADRCLLTRRRFHPGGAPIIEVHFDLPKDQLREILPVIKPYLDRAGFMTRCLRCNAVLEEVDRRSVEQSIPEFTFHSQKRFRRCPSCSRIYWPGSHGERMKGLLQEILGDGGP